ncbi:MAG: putative Ig domain-containing protein, partial [Candidatus Methanospirare jalkutatii]|nr:putative Ig domain-containing protein [Candidatus Methanospirare jalkutatii]
KTVYEGSLLEFTVSAYDPDNDTLSFAASNLPRGASFDPVTRKFIWTPDYEQAGSYKVHFEVSDGYYNDSEDITITVINVNRPPKITYFVPENGSVFNESDVITIKVIASDPDNDNIYYEIKIDNVTVSTNSSYTWETNYSSAGEHKITACVSDGYAEVSETHTIIINNVVPRWDVNEDCVVDISDLTIVGQHFGEEFISPPYPRYDVNADGVVDVSDVTIVGQHFGEMTCI